MHDYKWPINCTRTRSQTIVCSCPCSIFWLVKNSGCMLVPGLLAAHGESACLAWRQRAWVGICPQPHSRAACATGVLEARSDPTWSVIYKPCMNGIYLQFLFIILIFSFFIGALRIIWKRARKLTPSSQVNICVVHDTWTNSRYSMSICEIPVITYMMRATA